MKVKIIESEARLFHVTGEQCSNGHMLQEYEKTTNLLVVFIMKNNRNIKTLNPVVVILNRDEYSKEMICMKTGLVLEGGAMRGMYTAGVLDIFIKNNVKVDGVVGVSAGALFGVNYLSGQAGRVIRYNKKYNHDKNYMGLRPLIREGNIIATKYAYEDVPRRLDPFDDERFRRSGIPFYAVLTEVETARPEYVLVRSGFEQMDVLRASGSMPFVSQPVKIGGRYYLDGGITDSIPFRWMHDQGYEKIIVILTRDMEYRKKPMPGIITGIYGIKHPELAGQLKTRHSRYNAEVELLRQWENDGKALVIRPSEPLDIGRLETDPDRLQKIYDIGIADGEAALDKVRNYIGEGC